MEAAGGKVNDYIVGDALVKRNRVVAGAPGVFDQLDTRPEEVPF
jgi:myo-inositol-1(or 4)-monophosphatase